LSQNATPKAKYFFNRMQIFSSLALSLSHGANDAQKPMGIIMMSLIILGIYPTFHIPFWVIVSCAAAIALGTASGGWRIIKTVGSRIYRLRSVHAFCAQTSSAAVILGAALFGGPVSTTHVVSSALWVLALRRGSQPFVGVWLKISLSPGSSPSQPQH
ncbi:MAG: inorganic phosphate transporter, partial [Desulfobacterales bacterium]|nr:inorganic phosphate transporter [Desulfobacterales bacterium]